MKCKLGVAFAGYISGCIQDAVGSVSAEFTMSSSVTLKRIPHMIDVHVIIASDAVYSQNTGPRLLLVNDRSDVYLYLRHVALTIERMS